MDVTEAIDLICNGDKKDKGCSSQGNVKQIQKLCTWQRECNMRCTDPNGHFSARKNPQELGFDLDLHKGIVERNFFKKIKSHTCPSWKRQVPAPVLTRPVAVCSVGPGVVFSCSWTFPRSPDVCLGRDTPRTICDLPGFSWQHFSALDIKLCKKWHRYTVVGPLSKRVHQ